MWFHLRLLERCNLRCRHCYAKDHDRSPVMSPELFESVLDTIACIPASHSQPPVAYLSGGEPLLHPEFGNIVSEACHRFDQVNVLTNGLLVNRWLDFLADKRGRVAVQVSVEGDRACNDEVRGPGTYDRAVAALRGLKECGIIHWISYTVATWNRGCYRSVVDLASETESHNNNVTPYCGDPQYMLDFAEWERFKSDFDSYSNERYGRLFRHPGSCGFAYDCAEYHFGLTFNPDGTFTGCARNPRVRADHTGAPESLIARPRLMNGTCMRAKWLDEEHFQWLTRLRV